LSASKQLGLIYLSVKKIEYRLPFHQNKISFLSVYLRPIYQYRIMKSKLKVFKFGGASIRDVEGIQRVGRILQTYKDESIVIVVSAMGKTTNALETVVRSYFDQDGQAEGLLIEIMRQHYELIQALFGEGN